MQMWKHEHICICRYAHRDGSLYLHSVFIFSFGIFRMFFLSLWMRTKCWKLGQCEVACQEQLFDGMLCRSVLNYWNRVSRKSYRVLLECGDQDVSWVVTVHQHLLFCSVIFVYFDDNISVETIWGAAHFLQYFALENDTGKTLITKSPDTNTKTVSINHFTSLSGDKAPTHLFIQRGLLLMELI